MDIHRSWYHAVRDEFAGWLDSLDAALQKTDPEYAPTPGRQAIHRINNNLMFHPHKPTYKDHFGATMDRVKNKSDFYIHLGVEETFIGCGYYHPGREILKRIRDGIDYNGEVLQKILEAPEFRRVYGSLEDEDKLRTSPKGYSSDHPHIHLLRNRSYAVMHRLKEKDVKSDGFREKVIQLYRIAMPFRHYLNQAVFFTEE